MKSRKRLPLFGPVEDRAQRNHPYRIVSSQFGRPIASPGKRNAMSDTMGSNNYIELAADIVSAYVSNNSVPASDLPALINEVHSALLRVTAGQPVAAAGDAEARRPSQEVDHQRIYHLPGGRQEVQIVEAAPADAVQYVARRISGEMGPAGGLPDGRAKLRQGALQSRQADGAWPAAPAQALSADFRLLIL